jgi:RNA polymerase sigma factor (TIGR02999 family)
MSSSITELLVRSSGGQAEALQELYARLYPDIKRVARARLAQSGGVSGLNTTALVHEGFLRMAEQEGLQGVSRGQFFAYVGQGRDKRGGEAVMVTLSHAEAEPAALSSATDMLALDRALARMREIDVPLYELIEMQAFAGLSIAELAELRGVSTRTINRDLIKARALLQALLGDAPETEY